MRYKIVQGESREHLEKLVNDAIKEGWQPFGGLTVVQFVDNTTGQHTTGFWQSMLKRNVRGPFVKAMP